MKAKVFRVHFNRIAMQRGDSAVWSVVTSAKCFHGAKVIMKGRVETQFDPNKKNNPRAFFYGKGTVTQHGDTILCKVSLLLLLLLIPVSSQAQLLKLPTVVFASAAGADWASTYRAVTRYHLVEQNPLINPLQSRPVVMVAAGAAIDLAGVVAWKHLMRHHTRLGAVGLYVAAAGRLYLAGRNISRSRRPSFWSGGTAGIK